MTGSFTPCLVENEDCAELHGKRRKEAPKCGQAVVIVTCGCGRAALPSFCGKRDCAAGGEAPRECGEKTHARRAREVARRFPVEGKKAAPLGYLVATIPPAHRPYFVDRAKFQELRRRCWALLKAEGADFAIEATHPVGDPAPCTCGNKETRWDWTAAPPRGTCDVCGADLQEAEFHPHLNFLWHARGGRRPWIVEARFREAWRLALEEVSGMGCLEVVFHNKYVLTAGELRHKARYVTRLFPGFHGWIGNVTWYGGKAVPKKEEEEECPCPKCGQLRDVTRPMEKWRAELILGAGPRPRPYCIDGQGLVWSLDYLQDYEAPDESIENDSESVSGSLGSTNGNRDGP